MWFDPLRYVAMCVYFMLFGRNCNKYAFTVFEVKYLHYVLLNLIHTFGLHFGSIIFSLLEFILAILFSYFIAQNLKLCEILVFSLLFYYKAPIQKRKLYSFINWGLMILHIVTAC